MNLLVYTLITFLLTLDSYYDYNLDIAYLPYFGFFILLIYQGKIFLNSSKFSLNELSIPIFILLSIIPSVFIGIFDLESIISMNKIYALTCGCIVFIIFNRISDKSFICIAVRNVILIHLTFFFIQFFAHYIFNYDLDFLSWFSGEKQRTSVGRIGLPILGSYFRASGLFNEPSTYSSYITALYCLISYNKNYEKNNFIENSIFLSNLLTFSFHGIFLSMIFYISKLIRSDNKINPIYVIRNLKIKISGIIIFSICFPLFMEIINWVSFRINTYPEVLQLRLTSLGYLDIYKFYFGNGILNTAILDQLLGVLVFFLSQVGLFLFLAFLFYVFKIKKSRHLVPLILLGFCKVTIYSPFIFLAISSYFKEVENTQNIKNNFS